jgi:CubicO group peptidase (beta-lactamase class C family)
MELRQGTPCDVGLIPERIGRARDLCAGWVKSGHTPAIVALVARRGVVVLHEAFGTLRPDDDSPPLRVDSLFPIRSITKPMAATLILQLVEDGLLGLNRPVRDYLPELSGEGTEDVLVHHLLTHTSGYDDFTFIAAHADKYADIDRISAEELTRRTLDLLLATPLSARPGEVMSYTPIAYNLLGNIIERVSGRPLPDLMQERLFDPLGMGDSYVVVPESVRSRIVKRPPDAPWNQNFGPMAAIDSRIIEESAGTEGSVFSTAWDVAIFGQMFLNGGTYGGARILSRPAVVEMTRNQIPGIPVQLGPTSYKEASYGFGWFVRSNEKWKYWDGSLTSLGEFHHQGAGGVLLWVDPPKEIVGVYFSVDLGITPEFDPLWNADLFQNVISSAVAD